MARAMKCTVIYHGPGGGGLGEHPRQTWKNTTFRLGGGRTQEQDESGGNSMCRGWERPHSGLIREQGVLVLRSEYEVCAQHGGWGEMIPGR